MAKSWIIALQADEKSGPLDHVFASIPAGSAMRRHPILRFLRYFFRQGTENYDSRCRRWARARDVSLVAQLIPGAEHTGETSIGGDEARREAGVRVSHPGRSAS